MHTDDGLPAADFDSFDLRDGARLHVRRTDRFKSVWVDLFQAEIMQPVAVTRRALLARLLERGTRRFPDLRSLNRHTDWLYGAALSAQTVGVGPFQALHLHFDAVDPAFLPEEAPDLLSEGLTLLGELLSEPCLSADGGFPAERVQQEKESLRRFAESLDADRSGLAQRRCLRQLTGESPWSLPAHGDPADLDGLDGGGLRDDLRDIAASAPIDVYVCGDVDAQAVARACEERLRLGASRRAHASVPPAPAASAAPESGALRRIDDVAAASQGRLVLGLQGDITLAGPVPSYAALLLLNLVLGGDAHSRLYAGLREDRGLCYHVGSWFEPMGGFLLVEAGIEATDREAVVAFVASTLDDLARQGPAADELERSRALARQRLESAADAREGLVRFDLARRLAGTDVSRRLLHHALSLVTPADVARAARGLRLCVDYLLRPESTP